MAKKRHHKKMPVAPAPKSVNEPVKSPWLSWLMWGSRICLTGAVIMAAYLLTYALSNGPISGCGSGSGCDRVLSSPWAYCLGIPVSAPALLVYLALVMASFWVSKPQTSHFRLWQLVIGLALAVISASLWFTGLQIWQLKSLCKFCALAHGSAVAGSVLLLSQAPLRVRAPKHLTPGGGPALPLRRVMLSAISGLAAVMALAGLQHYFPARTNFVKILDGRIQIDTRVVPLIGPADAPYKIVSLFDYTCPHCRELHHLLVQAQERFGRQFSIVSLPVPLDARCNPVVKVTPRPHVQACDYARLGLALWQTDPQAFLRFDRWIFEEKQQPPLEKARSYAAELIGESRLARAMTNAWTEQTLKIGVGIYEENGRQSGSYRMPQLIVGRAINTGTITRLEDLVSLLQTNLSMTPRL